ncbi:MAG: hypothetical protein U9R51_03725 [Actinomycetota bacterium]|nr:hypothetical protein [Actinomycetota bacterium]
MKQWFIGLPGPMALKIVIAVVLALVALVTLFLVYDWIGSSLLDSGGTIG